jgi:hypothetical protein
MSLLTGLFRDNGDAHAEKEEIVLAEFNLRPANTIDVTPGAAEPASATVVAEPVRLAGESELRGALERLTAGMVDAWNSAVRDMARILAADHARREVSAAELHRVTEELAEIRRRLDTQAGVLRDLHSAAEAQAARSRNIAAAVTKFVED